MEIRDILGNTALDHYRINGAEINSPAYARLQKAYRH